MEPAIIGDKTDSPELWAGVECSVVRIGDQFRDQICETGHASRLSDLDLVAAIGIRTMRYPVLWERVAPEALGPRDWRWTDERLTRLRNLGIQPIVGLVHHGSGPLYSNLLDPAFPEHLAAYAAEVAARYPWIEMWTPVNEPLTTARFSCLYGHWYPHRRDLGAFMRATVNQCRAVALSMAAVRRFNPRSRLVQTEDIGRIFSTPKLAYQAEHENQRRWLSLDLLTGRVTSDHPWHKLLLNAGVEERQLAELRDGLGRPDIIGINYYLTTDRFLDHRLDLYPGVALGGNGRDTYVDVEAVRVSEPGGELGPAARLREAWDRYRLPMAVTEVHNNCTHEEQLRWLMEVWDAVQVLRTEGANVRAVTLWSIFGAVDWSSLLTQNDGVREPGIFDLRGSIPRRTLLANAATELAARGQFSHPVLDTPGWWRRESRYVASGESCPSQPPVRKARPILFTGALDSLKHAFSRICDARGLSYVLDAGLEFDTSDADALSHALKEHRPWAVIHIPRYMRGSRMASMADLLLEDDAAGAERLAAACAERTLPLMTFSSDLVFDGQAGRPYLEHDAINPVGIYGAAMHGVDRCVLDASAQSLVIRSGALFGPWDARNFVWATLHAAAHGRKVVVDGTQIVSPTYVPDLVNATLDLLLDGECGLWHVANPAEINWYDFAVEVVTRTKFDPSLVRRPEIETQLRNIALSSERAVLLRPLDAALSAYFRDTEPRWSAE